MIDLNEFTNLYLETNKDYINNKISVLENFRKREEELRSYEEILSELDKKSIDSHLSSFSNLEKKIFYFLLDFNPNDIDDNISNVQAVIEYLNEKKYEFSKISDIFKFIIKTWESFIIRRNLSNKDTIFIEEIKKELDYLQSNFNDAFDQDINRVEEEATNLKQKILKIISIFEELHLLIENNVFIGKEALELKLEIIEFLENDFYNSEIIELIKRKEKLNESIKEIIENETIFDKKGLPVVKVKNLNKQDLYIYTVEFDDYLLEYQNENLNPNSIILEHTNKKIYIDNYPIKGIFKIKDIKDLIKISENQFLAMEEFDIKSTNTFYFSTATIILLSGLSIFSVFNLFITLLSVSGVIFLFYYYFYSLLAKMEKKYNVKDLFFFIPTNFYLISIGDKNFNYKELIFNILVNAEKTILKIKRGPPWIK